MTALLLSVFVASLLGSLHCVGMCGGFVALSCGGPGCAGAGATSAWTHVGYHGGRFLTYGLVGVLAGFLGQLLDMAGTAGGITQVATLVAGGIMLLWGGLTLAQVAGLKAGAALERLPIVRALASRVTRVFGVVATRPPTHRALLIGLLTPLLPCGWLYLFAVTAAGTGSPLWGGAVMLTFWAGTVPLLVGFGVGVQALLRRNRQLVPVLSGLALIVVGASAIVQRAAVPTAAAQLETLSGEQAQERVESFDQERLPCCGGAKNEDPTPGTK